MKDEATQWVRFDWSLSGVEFPVAAPPGYVLRPGTPDDIEALRRLVVEAYGSDPSWDGQTDDIERRVMGRIRDRISDPTAHFLVALYKTEIVGLNGVALNSPTMMNLITGICVDPAHQGKGLGSILLGASLAWLRDQGLSTATVTTDIRSVAAKVYARFGAIRVPNVPYDDAPKNTNSKAV